MEFITHSAKETQLIAKGLTEKLKPLKIRALVLGFKGELGTGKTTFIQSLGQTLGIKEKILSPTFVIMKKYRLTNEVANKRFRNFYHIDCYRFNEPKEFLELGFGEIVKNPQNLVVIEWAEKIKKILPAQTIWLEFEHLGGDKRKIKITNRKIQNM